jgi:ATP-binding protein involved in chromosome partitioning
MKGRSRDGRDSGSGSFEERKSDEARDAAAEHEALARRMGQIAHKVLVLSGKGGVGKSTVAVHLARSLARAGKRVGVLDIDIHGPSIPRLLGLDRLAAETRRDPMSPVDTSDGLRVMSIGFLLPEDDRAVVWRGPLKMRLIKEFLGDLDWGELDYLVIDSPPGTGDEPLSVCQLIPDADGAIIVTTPQEVALADVRKSISFCREVGMPILGVIENMSGFVCPKCGAVTDIFKSGGGKRMALEAGRPDIGELGDSGARAAFDRAIEPILELGGEAPQAESGRSDREESRAGTSAFGGPGVS